MGVLHELGTGLRDAGSMLWMTWWPLVLGFTLAGLVQALVPRGGLERRLGGTGPGTLGVAALAGFVSSSCSYAASAMARALFKRGASWTSAVVFMVASTNLVVELGVVLWVILGAPFVVAQLVGGLVMVTALGLVVPLAFGARRTDRLRARVGVDRSGTDPARARPRWREPARYAEAARYARGDLTMVWRELLAGFVIAGFVSGDVPASWWRHFFIPGHGFWTLAENVAVAPVVAALSCVCSVGNVPLAGALWAHGIAFGGVIAFVFADLLTLPLLVIYRRFYGAATALRLAGTLFAVVVVAGLVVDGLFAAFGEVPADRHVRLTSGQFPLGATLVANVAAVLVATALWWASSRSAGDELATDPMCGMTVRRASAAATLEADGVTYWFCSPRCADRFAATRSASAPVAPEVLDVDPVCQMEVTRADAPSARDLDGRVRSFCGPGCRDRFVAERDATRSR